jgi:hypothetical protein
MFFTPFYRVGRVETKEAVALWYNTYMVSTLTHGNVLDASYASKNGVSVCCPVPKMAKLVTKQTIIFHV